MLVFFWLRAIVGEPVCRVKVIVDARLSCPKAVAGSKMYCIVVVVVFVIGRKMWIEVSESLNMRVQVA